MLGWVFVKSIIDLANPANAYGGSVFGIGAPLAIGIVSLILGVLLMILQWISAPEFFRRKLETSDPAVRM